MRKVKIMFVTFIIEFDIHQIDIIDISLFNIYAFVRTLSNSWIQVAIDNRIDPRA